MTSPAPLRAAHLTVFRFVAALVVVIYHYGREATGWGGILTAGPQMVTFFFVLSGFVMVLAYGAAGPLSVRRYWWARAIRILPAYYLALLASIVILRCMNLPIGWTQLALSLGLAQAWWSPYALKINPPAWSLSVEATFYLLFPLLFVYLNRVRLRHWITLSLILWLVTQLGLGLILNTADDLRVSGWPVSFVLYHPLSHLCSFALGIAAGLGYRRLVSRPTSWREQMLLLLVSLVILFFVGSEAGLQQRSGVLLAYGGSFWAPLFAGWVLLFARAPDRIAGFFGGRIAVNLGEISFGLYIFQAPVHLLWVAISPLGRTTTPISFALFLLTLLIVAQASYSCLEQPLRRRLLTMVGLGYRVSSPASFASADRSVCR